MVPLLLRIALTRSQIVWQCDRLATTSVRRVNNIASVPPYLLRSAFGHDGLWVFANRIFASFPIGAAAGGGGSLRGKSAAPAALSMVNNPTVMLNTPMNPAVLNTAKNAVVTTLMSLFTLIPPCLSKPSDERPRDGPY